MNDLKDIVKWLRGLEHDATEFYLHAASVYSDDPRLKKFLEHTAEEEAWHYHIMGSASEYLASHPELVSAISVDRETRETISGHFPDMQARLDRNELSRDELIEKIVEVELSEWNDIFLYVVNILKKETSEFRFIAPKLQAHIKSIEYFLEKIEKRPDVLQRIKEIPPLWIENILVVDDEILITELIKALLHHSGKIDIAHNGNEALEMLDKKFYKLIISDIDMPELDGLSFFQKAAEKFPRLSGKFLFMTGNISQEREFFFKENNIEYLEKPMGINELREKSLKIILSE